MSQESRGARGSVPVSETCDVGKQRKRKACLDNVAARRGRGGRGEEACIRNDSP